MPDITTNTRTANKALATALEYLAEHGAADTDHLRYDCLCGARAYAEEAAEALRDALRILDMPPGCRYTPKATP